MFDYRNIEQQVKDYIPAEYLDDYDLDAVMDELRGIWLIDGDYEGEIRTIDDIDIDDVLCNHDISNR